MRITIVGRSMLLVGIVVSGCQLWELEYRERADGGIALDGRMPQTDARDGLDARAPTDADAAFDADRADASDGSSDAGELDGGGSSCGDAGCAIDCAAERARIVGAGGALDNPIYIFSPVVVHGERACVLLAGPSGRPFAGIEALGRGRVVVFGHGTPLEHMLPDAVTSGLTERAITWAAGRETPVVAVDRDATTDPLPEWLRERGWRVVALALDELGPGVADVWVGKPPAIVSTEDAEALGRFVDAGGGAVIGAQGWTWRASHPLTDASELAANQMLPGSGLMLAPSSLPVAETQLDTASPVHALSHAGRALDAVRASLDGDEPLDASDASLAWRVLSDALDVVRLETPFGAAARALLAAYPAVPPTEAEPLEPDVAPLDAVRVRIAARLGRSAPSSWLGDVRPGDFPGPATGTPVRTTVSIDATFAGLDAVYTSADGNDAAWQSTGLYAAPGATVSVDVPAALVVQIGVHAQTLWNDDSWTRVPEVVRRAPLDAASVTVTSAYGGPIVILVPAGTSAGTESLVIDGALVAPVFTAGDDAAAWRVEIDRSTVPWTELVGRRVVLDVPTAAARAVADPAALVAFWDDVLDAMADLAGLSRERARLERVVYDRQLAGGSVAASGYPAYRGTRVVDLALDLAYLRESGDWGTWFALGQNHVSRDWLLPGAISAAPNVLNVYAFHRVLGRTDVSVPPPHVELEAARRAARRSAYVSGGRDLAGDWSEWTALETYLQLIESLGWDVIDDAIASYLALAPSARPATDSARVQRWIRATSDAAALDLVPFYEGWGFPIDATTRAATSAHPAWTTPPPLP